MVGDTGIEPVTSSVSGKRATAAPIARAPEGARWDGADDRIRTGDPHLGKVMLYQLSYVRTSAMPTREDDMRVRASAQMLRPHSVRGHRRVAVSAGLRRCRGGAAMGRSGDDPRSGFTGSGMRSASSPAGPPRGALLFSRGTQVTLELVRTPQESM